MLGVVKKERAAIATSLKEISVNQDHNSGRLESALAKQSRELVTMIKEIQREQRLLQEQIQKQEERTQALVRQPKISFCCPTKTIEAEANLHKSNPVAAKIALDAVSALHATIKSTHGQIRSANESIIAAKASSLNSMTNQKAALQNDAERTRLLSSLELCSRELKSEMTELSMLQQTYANTEKEVISEHRVRLETFRTRLIQETNGTSSKLKAERKGLEKILSAFKAFCNTRTGKAQRIAHKERKVQKRFSTTFLLPK